MAPESYRWRKTTDINRDHAVFELLRDEIPILDIARSDEGKLDIVFNPPISGVIIDWTELLALLEEGRVLSERDL